jgi:hypothetical protein
MASPRIFPGQRIDARLIGADRSAEVCLYLRCYGADDQPTTVEGDVVHLSAGQRRDLEWQVPTLPGPAYEVGIRVGAGAEVRLDSLGFSGTPEVDFERPAHNGTMWRRAWVNGVDELVAWRHLPEMLRLIQNQGTGLVMQGTREWRDYSVSAELRPHLARRAGVAARVQGMTRYYALVLSMPGRLQLVRSLHEEAILAEADFDWSLGETYRLTISVKGDRLLAAVDGEVRLECADEAIEAGGMGILIDEGRLEVQRVTVRAP